MTHTVPLLVTALFSWLMIDVWSRVIDKTAEIWFHFNFNNPWHCIIVALFVTLIFGIGYYLYSKELEESQASGIGII